MDSWILFSLLALAANVAKVLTIRLKCRQIDARVVIFCGRVTSAVVLMPFLWISGNGIPRDGIFWLVIVVTSLLTLAASILYTSSVQHGRLTVVIPMQAAVPVFSLLTLWIFWRELPRMVSIVLMLLSMAAIAWTLYADIRDKAGDGKMIFGLFSLASAVLFGVSTILDRTAIRQVACGALAYSACWNLFSVFLMAGEVIRGRCFRKIQWRQSLFPLILYSISVLAAFYFQQYAVQLSQTIAGAVVNVKSIVTLHLPIIVLLQIIALKQRPGFMTIAAGMTAIVLSILLLRSLV